MKDIGFITVLEYHSFQDDVQSYKKSQKDEIGISEIPVFFHFENAEREKFSLQKYERIKVLLNT